MDELKRCVATNLVQLRMTKGWTQAELAELVWLWPRTFEANIGRDHLADGGTEQG